MFPVANISIRIKHICCPCDFPYTYVSHQCSAIERYTSHQTILYSREQDMVTMLS